MRTLVTGGGGFLGRYIAEQLVDRGDEVRVLCRSHRPFFDDLGIDWHCGDIRDKQTVAAACAGMDAVFHTAGRVGIWGPWKEFYGINVTGTRNVIDGCRQQGVGQLIYTSSPSVVYDGREHEGADESLPYPERFLCHYSHTKALAEQAVLEANGSDGLLTVALRPHLIWGPRDTQLVPRLIDRARRKRLIRIGDGRNLISMTYVENAAAGHLQAAAALSEDSPVAGEAYFVNDPEPVNAWGWIDEVLIRMGLPRVERSISGKAAWRAGAVIEWVYRGLRLPNEPLMTRFLASQLSSSHYYDISKARRDFFEPIVDANEGMRRLEADLKNVVIA